MNENLFYVTPFGMILVVVLVMATISRDEIIKKVMSVVWGFWGSPHHWCEDLAANKQDAGNFIMI